MTTGSEIPARKVNLDPVAVAAEYQAAYQLANPGSPPVDLTYVRGWFVLRYPGSGYADKFRAKKILEFAGTLRNRARRKEMRLKS